MYFKRKNKGFTLIELLMTVALLSVISVISFVSINAIILKNRDNQCKNTASSIKMAAKDFFSYNRLELLKDPNKTSISGATYDSDTGYYTVSVYSLASGNYLSGDITNPYNSNKKLTTSQLKKIKVELKLKEDKTVDSNSIIIVYNDVEGNLFGNEDCVK